MKIGEIIKRLQTGNHNPEAFSFELEMRRLPKNCLDDFFQEKFNKGGDYDQWVGIREALEGMGNRLYELSLSLIGTAIYEVRREDENKIQSLESGIKEISAKLKSTLERLEKYEDIK